MTLDLDAIREAVERRTEILNRGRLTAEFVTMLGNSLNEERALLAEVDRPTAERSMLVRLLGKLVEDHDPHDPIVWGNTDAVCLTADEDELLRREVRSDD